MQRGRADALAMLVATAMALAGCLAPAGPGATPDGASGLDATAGSDGAALASPATVGLPGCREFHVFYPSDWAGWAAVMPPGFGPDGTDPTGTLTTLYQHVSLCALPDATSNGAEAREVAVAWTGVRVTPPADLALEDAVVQAVPIDLIVSDPGLAATYRAWGLDDVVRDGTVTLARTPLPGSLEVGSLTLQAGSATIRLDYQTAPGTEGSVDGAGRVFAVHDREVTGWFDYTWPTWVEMGLGAVAFTASNDPDAPPAYAGSIHHVEDVDLTVTYAARPGPPQG